MRITAVWGALNFVAQNREAMVRDQVEIFPARFLSSHSSRFRSSCCPSTRSIRIRYEPLPGGYVIPADAPFQLSPQAPARLVDFLLLMMWRSNRPAGLHPDSVEYPAGSMSCGSTNLRRLANTILSDGPRSVGYPRPGVLLAAYGLDAPAAVKRAPRSDGRTDGPCDAPGQQGWTRHRSAEAGKGAYAYLPTSITAIQATNDLLARRGGRCEHLDRSPMADD
jgi:hypothetical protein